MSEGVGVLIRYYSHGVNFTVALKIKSLSLFLFFFNYVL